MTRRDGLVRFVHSLYSQSLQDGLVARAQGTFQFVLVCADTLEHLKAFLLPSFPKKRQFNEVLEIYLLGRNYEGQKSGGRDHEPVTPGAYFVS